MDTPENLRAIVTDLKQQKADIDRMLPAQLQLLPNIAAITNKLEQSLTALDNAVQSLQQGK